MPTRATPLALALALAFLAACATRSSDGTGGDSGAIADSTGATAAGTAAPCPPGNGGLTLPQGFCATIVAESLGAARHLVVAPNGDIFVNVQGAQRGTGARQGIVAMRDTNRDGRADRIERFGEKGGTGIALDGGYLYQDIGDAIVRWPIAAGSLAPSGSARTIVSGLPTGGHAARNFAIADGSLYVNVGSETNSCQANDRGNRSPGNDPCTELATRAGIWKFSATQEGQRFSPGARWATGIRNAVALTRGADGAIWVAQHGRDQLTQNWGYSDQDGAEKPAEELMRLTEGSDFGWPYCYYDRQQGKRVLAPEYGGKGTDVGRCADKAAPAATYPGHWAPNGLLFYSGSMFPQRYRGGAFIAFHGSWNRAPLPQQGFKVVFQPMSGDKPAGEFETFAEGAAPAPDATSREGRLRPTGLAQGPDGALYLTDDGRGIVWRITAGGR